MGHTVLQEHTVAVRVDGTGGPVPVKRGAERIGGCWPGGTGWLRCDDLLLLPPTSIRAFCILICHFG